MPTYEYVCDSCGRAFERFQSIKEEPVRACPECGHKVRRLISAGAGVIFKGSGFYQTDYRSKSYQEAAKKETPAKKEKESKPAPPASSPAHSPQPDASHPKD